MQPVAVELSQLILPAELPFREHVFLQRVMRFDDDHGGGSFEAHAAYDADDGIAHMNITPYAVRPCKFLNELDRTCRMIEGAVVHLDRLALHERQLDCLAAV